MTFSQDRPPAPTQEVVQKKDSTETKIEQKNPEALIGQYKNEVDEIGLEIDENARQLRELVKLSPGLSVETATTEEDLADLEQLNAFRLAIQELKGRRDGIQEELQKIQTEALEAVPEKARELVATTVVSAEQSALSLVSEKRAAQDALKQTLQGKDLKKYLRDERDLEEQFGSEEHLQRAQELDELIPLLKKAVDELTAKMKTIGEDDALAKEGLAEERSQLSSKRNLLIKERQKLGSGAASFVKVQE